MKEIQSLIVANEPLAARARLATRLAAPDAQHATLCDATVELLDRLYDSFQVAGVEGFCEDSDLDFPGELSRAIEKRIKPRIENTATWLPIVQATTRERLARECRRAIVLKDLKLAASLGATLLGRARTHDEMRDSANYLATALATLYHDRDRCEQTIVLIGQQLDGSARQAAPMLDEQFMTLVIRTKQTGFEESEQAWLRAQNEAVVALREYLPGGNEVGDPDPGQLEKFHEHCHAILRAAFSKRRPEEFVDAVIVLSEYCPCDERDIANQAGIEPPMFTRLGLRARLVAVRTMRRLGENEVLRKAVLGLAGSRQALGHEAAIAAMMGGLGHADFFPYLKGELDKVGEKKRSRLESNLVEALGRVGSPEAVKVLLTRLERALKHLKDNVQEDRALELIGSLARVARSKDFGVENRNKLVRRIVHLVDRGSRRLTFETARQLIAVRAKELEPELIEWGARRIVDAMWGQPWQKVGHLRASENGWREPMVQALRALGNDALPAVLDEAQRHAAHFSGAMAALANALAEIGDERALPLMESMIRATFLHNEEKQSALLREEIRDAASGEVRELERDEMLHAMFYALDQFGGEQGTEIILQYADQVQSGRLENPGDRTSQILLDTKLKHGGARGGPAPRAHLDLLTEEEFDKALSDARGGLFTKKAAQIAAIARLGQARREEAVPVLVELLGHKETMLHSAAHTALAQYLQPPPDETDFCMFIDGMLAHHGKLKGRIVEGLMTFVTQEMPRNPPYDKLFERQMTVNLEDEALMHRLRGAFNARPQAAAKTASNPPPSASTDSLDEPSDGEIAGAELSLLDRKRAYMQARRAWLDSGRKGPEPQPPT